MRGSEQENGRICKKFMQTAHKKNVQETGQTIAFCEGMMYNGFNIHDDSIVTKSKGEKS